MRFDVGDVVCLGVINAPQMVVTDTRVVVADAGTLGAEANCTWFTLAGEMHTCWFSEQLLRHDLREIDFARGSEDSACAR